MLSTASQALTSRSTGSRDVGQPPQLLVGREVPTGMQGMQVVQGCHCDKDSPPQAYARAGTGTKLRAKRPKNAKVWHGQWVQSIGRRPESSLRQMQNGGQESGKGRPGPQDAFRETIS